MDFRVSTQVTMTDHCSIDLINYLLGEIKILRAEMDSLKTDYHEYKVASPPAKRKRKKTMADLTWEKRNEAYVNFVKTHTRAPFIGSAEEENDLCHWFQATSEQHDAQRLPCEQATRFAYTKGLVDGLTLCTLDNFFSSLATVPGASDPDLWDLPLQSSMDVSRETTATATKETKATEGTEEAEKKLYNELLLLANTAVADVSKEVKEEKEDSMGNIGHIEKNLADTMTMAT